MVSARLTVVPQMALISSGSSEGAAGAERLGAALDIGTSRWVPSELRLSGSAFLTEGRRARRADAVGVMEKDEWMSPRRFLGVFVTNGLLRDSIMFKSMLIRYVIRTMENEGGRNLLDLLRQVIRRVCGVFSLGKSLEMQ